MSFRKFPSSPAPPSAHLGRSGCVGTDVNIKPVHECLHTWHILTDASMSQHNALTIHRPQDTHGHGCTYHTHAWMHAYVTHRADTPKCRYTCTHMDSDTYGCRCRNMTHICAYLHGSTCMHNICTHSTQIRSHTWI